MLRASWKGHSVLRHLSENEDGATAIEYGLIAALISISSIIAFQMLGLNLADIQHRRRCHGGCQVRRRS